MREKDFCKVSENGFGDGFNAYAYSMAWFNDHIRFKISPRANLRLLKMAMPFVRMDIWPVETPFKNYSPEFERSAARGEIWRYCPPTGEWSGCINHRWCGTARAQNSAGIWAISR